MRPSILALAIATALPAIHAGAMGNCDDTKPAAVVAANPVSLGASAIWLDRSLIVWPGSPRDGTFRLYHSPTGAIVAQAGAHIAGHSGALELTVVSQAVPDRFKYAGAGPVLTLAQADLPRIAALHHEQLVLVRESADGRVIAASRLQAAGALDDLYAGAADARLGVTVDANGTEIALWAPTAKQVDLCLYEKGSGAASGRSALRYDDATGVWRFNDTGDLSGKYYRFSVDVIADGVGQVRNLVTDPYSISLTTDSQRSYIASLAAPALKPAGWDAHQAPATVKAQTDMTVYELHVRDFSINDSTVPAAMRGKYAAFGQTRSNGMRHLAALARAGMTDIHLLPVYDIASIPEKSCVLPQPVALPKSADTDCFNWGYDPWHYSAPEGSYASDPADGARRIVEFRQMVMNLHAAGLRVGMDVVYNHTFRSGQHERSVLDRIVPGYYHRLNAAGEVEQSTCCDNTATENLMMGKLMIDSAELWTREYRIDSFRFDLMGHQPRSVMEQLQARVNKAAGRHVQLIGEGWNFGEVENGARFVQASQLSLNGSGIGTFSDRARDHVRGGGASDSGEAMIKTQGYINGLVYDPNLLGGGRPVGDLLKSADMVRVGLAGSIRSFPMRTYRDEMLTLEQMDYSGQPAGYASEPGEAVNYVENHDNQTLYDMNVFKLPVHTSSADRARVQMLAAAINAFSQGVAYFHAGIDILRSKSLDRNSFNSGDWFNRLDWGYRDNYFGTSLPPEADNGKDYALMRPLLANPALKPGAQDIAFARDAFRDLLRIRASSTLFRLRSAADIRERLRFYNTGSAQTPTVLAAEIKGEGYPDAGFKSVVYLINVDKVTHTIVTPELKGRALRLHPVHTSPHTGDTRAAESRYDSGNGSISVPARTAVVLVEQS